MPLVWGLFFLFFASFLVCQPSFCQKTSEECQLFSESSNTNFLYLDMTEDTGVGVNLGSFHLNGVTQIGIIETDLDDDYLEFQLDRTVLSIRLVKSLENYFETRSLSNFQMVLQLNCSSNYSLEVILLVSIHDVNNKIPKWRTEGGEETEALDIQLPLPWPLDVPITKTLVLDQDFLPANAQVNLSCEGECEHFEFGIQPASSTILDLPGHTLEVFIYLKAQIPLEEIVYSFNIIANDSMHGSRIAVKVATAPEVLESSTIPVIPIAVGGGVAVLVLLAVSTRLGFSMMKVRKTKEILDKLTQVEINEFREGCRDRRGSMALNDNVAVLPFKSDYEIPRESLLINETCVLGSGAFGVVYKGSVLRDDVVVEVAVKMLKRNNTRQYFKALLDELKIMAYIGRHPNVLRLVGSCSKNIKKLELYIAVEFCQHGNIRDFLRCRRAAFSNLVADGVLVPPSSMSYLARQSSFSNLITTMDLVDWAAQVANGMDYLSSKQVIHADLAGRNILIDSERMAKISDFGLSRRLLDYTNYSNNFSNTPLPLRWMAPESLKFKRFSTKSDRWSYGILLWEIFALGQNPYPGVETDEKFVDRIDSGLRMTTPEEAPKEVADIMQKCWNKADYNRPSFFEIKEVLQGIQARFACEKGDGYMSLGLMSAYSLRQGQGMGQARRNTQSSLPTMIREEDEMSIFSQNRPTRPHSTTVHQSVAMMF